MVRVQEEGCVFTSIAGDLFKLFSTIHKTKKSNDNVLVKILYHLVSLYSFSGIWLSLITLKSIFFFKLRSKKSVHESQCVVKIMSVHEHYWSLICKWVWKPLFTGCHSTLCLDNFFMVFNVSYLIQIYEYSLEIRCECIWWNPKFWMSHEIMWWMKILLQFTVYSNFSFEYVPLQKSEQLASSHELYKI